MGQNHFPQEPNTRLSSRNIHFEKQFKLVQYKCLIVSTQFYTTMIFNDIYPDYILRPANVYKYLC